MVAVPIFPYNSIGHEYENDKLYSENDDVLE